jgi:hypothetical protein
MSAVEKIFSPCLQVAAAGLLGTSIAIFLYPPLEVSSLAVYSWPAIALIPVPVGFVFVHWRRLPRYAGLFRFAMFLIVAAFVIPGPYYFLNGLLDKNPPIAAQAIVSRKGTCCNVEWTAAWNGRKIVQVSGINREAFYPVEPGDALRVEVHSGAFSLPWYSDVLPPSTVRQGP